MISKAAKQEALLRKAEKELRERQTQETNLARELAEKEEANLQLEEHFSSLQEEVEVKTKKLKKLWNKYQAAAREAKDLQEEFQVRLHCYGISSYVLVEVMLPSLLCADGAHGHAGHHPPADSDDETQGPHHRQLHPGGRLQRHREARRLECGGGLLDRACE